jgi:hypothetical protein
MSMTGADENGAIQVWRFLSSTTNSITNTTAIVRYAIVAQLLSQFPPSRRYHDVKYEYSYLVRKLRKCGFESIVSGLAFLSATVRSEYCT